MLYDTQKYLQEKVEKDIKRRDEAPEPLRYGPHDISIVSLL